MTRTMTISSQLGINHLDELQQLLYFNQQQSSMLDGIVRSIDQYGRPTVYSEDELLRIEVGELSGVQALYALDRSNPASRLVGVMVYARPSLERLVLLHIGVSEDYSAFGENADAKLVVKLVLRLRKIARSIKGVTSVEIPYNPRGARIVPI